MGEGQVVLAAGRIQGELLGDGGHSLVDKLLGELDVLVLHVDDAAQLGQVGQHLLVIQMDAALNEQLLQTGLHVLKLLVVHDIVFNSSYHGVMPSISLFQQNSIGEPP